MRTLMSGCAAGVLLFSSTALAGQPAVPELTLESMGLVGMQQLSDDQGLEVRGKGDNTVFDQILIQTRIIEVRTGFLRDAAIKFSDITMHLGNRIRFPMLKSP